MKHLSLPLLALTTLSILTGCTSPNPPGPPVTPTFDLVLTPSSQTLSANTTGTVTASIAPRDGYNQPVTYSGQGDLTLTFSQQGGVFSVVSSVPGPHTLTVTATGQDGTTRSATASITVTAPDQGPNPVQPFFIPVANAPVGTGNGTPQGTVYVSPTAEELEVLNLVNEVRTKGTLYGQPALAGTCVDGSWTPRQAMTFNGLFAFAARKHAEYLSNVGYEGHIESNTSSSYYYGGTLKDRLIRAYREQAGTDNYQDGGEVAGTGRNSALVMVQAWLTSPAHCNILMDSRLTMFGSGMASGPVDTSVNRWGTSWDLVVGL